MTFGDSYEFVVPYFHDTNRAIGQLLPFIMNERSKEISFFSTPQKILKTRIKTEHKKSPPLKAVGPSFFVHMYRIAVQVLRRALRILPLRRRLFWVQA
jgi:hypothetical protein